MDEYESLRHMRKLNQDEIHSDNELYYLPHHAVVKECSTTTKVRVVFDASCSTSSGLALNDILVVGPTIQPSLFSTLMRFRMHQICLTADVEKMYRQILIHPDDRRYQRVIWRTSTDDKLRHYELNTVTYGMAPAPFLAIRALQQTAIDVPNISETARSCITNDFYVDDLLTGASSIEAALKLMNEVTETLGKAGFRLRKWSSNCPEIVNQLLCHQNEIVNISNDDEMKVLGIFWNSKSDTFSFNIDFEEANVTTKRIFLSQASRIFDPHGWLSPVVVSIKILFQSLWLTGIKWDDPLPEYAEREWLKLKNNLKSIQSIKIPRLIGTSNIIELHGFGDASAKAFASVVYLRTENAAGNIEVRLMASKTKVAPLKLVSIPRLELCAAQLTSKLLVEVSKSIESSHKIPIKIYGWSDSTTVLAWLAKHPSNWNVYVGNRVSFIISNTPNCQWRYVSTSENPADHASKGIAPAKLAVLKNWWEGPAWLSRCQSVWPVNVNDYDTKDEVRKAKTNTNPGIITEESMVQCIYQQTKSFVRAIRIMCMILRATRRMRRMEADVGAINANELGIAKIMLVKMEQQQVYNDELKQIKKNIQNAAILKHNNLSSLNPFIDGDGVLRVGGRLDNANNCTYAMKHPIILPKYSTLSKMIIHHIHNKFHHAGSSLTSHLIRQEFWIVNGRSSIRDTVKKCTTCIRLAGRTAEQLMGSLPTFRVSPSSPFTHCGVDFAGPIQVLSRNSRGAKTTKGYIAVFVCMATKGVHLELVSSLSTDDFINALKRFCGRRAVPVHMYSDNGKNFVGARRQLSEMHRMVVDEIQNNSLANYLSCNLIQWHFIPPSAPHFGGLWEAAVRIMKCHLIRVMKNSTLTYEELTTLMCEIEGIMNSRPLCPLNEDVSSLNVLTPSHFLTGRNTLLIPEPDLDEVPISHLTRWQLISKMKTDFWKRYQREYLNTLQQRNKWQTKSQPISVNDIVLVKEDNIPASKWAMGRVMEVHPGSDGLTRVVTLKMQNGTLKRPIAKVCLLIKDDTLMVGECSGQSSRIPVE